jgi:hypothetical protein
MAIINNLSVPADYYEFSGLSTDSKPTEGVGKNSLFYELDTKKVYYFDGTQWKEVGA